MKKLAMIGCGGIGGYHLGHFLQFKDIVELAGFCDLIPERAESFVEQAGCGKAFTDQYPDAQALAESKMTPDASLVPDAVWDLYAQYGGNMHLDGAWRHEGGHTVFGQVYAGMDVIDAIAAVETGENDKPLTAVTITSIEIIEYVAAD